MAEKLSLQGGKAQSLKIMRPRLPPIGLPTPLLNNTEGKGEEFPPNHSLPSEVQGKLATFSCLRSALGTAAQASINPVSTPPRASAPHLPLPLSTFLSHSVPLL